MGAKALYTDTKNKIISALEEANDIDALSKLDKDRQAYLKYALNWTSANLDEYMERFQVMDESFNMAHNKRKISFFDDGKEYEVVCAVVASYFRVQRKEAKAERNRLTHFRMTYKKGGE